MLAANSILFACLIFTTVSLVTELVCDVEGGK